MSRPPHLGEPGTEQFTLTTKLNGKVIDQKTIHDPFVHTRVTTTWWWQFWKPIVVEVNVSATHEMMSKVMQLDPTPSLSTEHDLDKNPQVLDM